MKQALTNLQLETLNKLDGGRPAIAFLKVLRQAALDCADRPLEKRPRQVTMRFEIVPSYEETDVKGVFVCTGTVGAFSYQVKVPPHRTKDLSFGIDRQGDLFFNENSPTNVRQMALDAMDDDDDLETK
jgi:hypothetical protein